MQKSEPVSNGAQNGNGRALYRLTQWAALVGRWEFDQEYVRYCAASRDQDADSTPTFEVQVPYGLALCSEEFRDGVISFALQLSRDRGTTGGVALGVRSATAPFVIVGLGGFDYAYSVVQFSPDRGFELIGQSGSLRNLSVVQEQSVEVSLDGQVVRMRVNDVPVLETVLRTPLSGSGLGLFAYDNADVRFRDVRVRKDPIKVFVMMPFKKEFDAIYEDVIKPEAEGLHFEIIRVDEIAGPGLILEDIRRQIERSHVVVAEVSTPNPNVFYELGYAHALNKPAVLLARRESEREMPFDIRPYRAIFYDDSIAGKKHVQEQLRNHLRASLHAG